jgi:hypothetical protein
MKIPALIFFAVALSGCARPHPHASVPPFSEQEVREFVTPGRTIAEITNRFGVPGGVMTNDGRIVMWFSNPINMDLINEAPQFGFSASFTNGMVEKWEAMHVSAQVIK